MSQTTLPARLVLGWACILPATVARAQLTDVVQTPNLANAGIQKSYAQQIGAGQGSLTIPESSLFLLARDPFRSIARGRQIFQRKFTMAEGLGPRAGDGHGNITINPAHGAGLTDSCAACHGRPHGSAGTGGDVFTRPDSRDAPHLFGLGWSSCWPTRSPRTCAPRATARSRSRRSTAAR